MIEKILDAFERTEYDFKKHVADNDPLEYLFPAWVEYYQLKYAISKAIQPKSILEIGVRFGYSAIAFLEASPQASYTGIDIDNDFHGGIAGAINWAKQITEEYKTRFIIGNTTKIDSFPGDFYDLIHVNAQQDGDGTSSDLEKAIEKGRYILVDGYFGSKPNMLSTTYFLEKYKEFIEYALVIPGYAGELLIKTKPNAKDIFRQRTGSYESLVDLYNSKYYLTDCGGYETFLQTNGKEIHDQRLLVAIYLSRPNKTKKILDIGSGRGELAFALSKLSFHVTGLDYSKYSIDIATKTFKGVENLNFVQADIIKYETDEKFDVILATDVVEHIEQDVVLAMFGKIKTLLRENGIFIVHTSPNKLKYVYGYANKRKIANSIGVYIPENPRTYYEDMMHINEQTPAGLRKALTQTFDSVCVCTASTSDAFGDFNYKPNKELLKKHDSIFAICSNDKLNKKDFLTILTQQPLNRESLDAKMVVLEKKTAVQIGEHFKIKVNVQNNSQERFISLMPYPVYLSYHWKDIENGEYVVFDGSRTALTLPLEMQANRDIDINIIAPEKIGNYRLEITMVQEGQFWFEQVLENFSIHLVFTISDAT